MACAICCPCSKRTGALLVGMVDLVFGAAGLSAVCFLLYIISKEIAGLQDDYTTLEFNERTHILTGLYWSVMLSYVFPAAVTLLTGIFAIFAVSHVSVFNLKLENSAFHVSENNDCCAITSILLTVILVFSCAGILLILYVLGIELPFFVPLIFATVVQAYFTFVLLSFRANDLKTQRTV